MELGIVKEFNNDSHTGLILAASSSDLLTFLYEDGQNMMLAEDSSTPEFSGHHEQPGRAFLKVPVAGDAVAFERSENGTISRWGYVHHFLDLAERRSPSIFR